MSLLPISVAVTFTVAATFVNQYRKTNNQRGIIKLRESSRNISKSCGTLSATAS